VIADSARQCDVVFVVGNSPDTMQIRPNLTVRRKALRRLPSENLTSQGSPQ
jgi:hypothetical protein